MEEDRTGVLYQHLFVLSHPILPAELSADHSLTLFRGQYYLGRAVIPDGTVMTVAFSEWKTVF